MKYLKSAVLPKDYPDTKRPEVAVVGRSNAGKSSFLNAISNSKAAHVSQTPGKTRLLSFFDFGEHYRFVDMPGYGFASRSGDEIREWTQMIEIYLSTRENLKGLVLIMDIRRDWTEDEELLKQFSTRMNLPMCVVLTKADKCSAKEKKDLKLKQTLDCQLADVFAVSSQTKEGVEDVEEFIFKQWVLPAKKEKK